MILLLLAPIAYVGNNACAACHPAIYRSYSQTPMAQSSGAVGGKLPPGRFRHAPSSLVYRLLMQDGRAFLRYERPGDRTTSGRQELHYFLGSAAAGRSYLLAIDRFLYQAPVTYYSQKKIWDVSPGYEDDRRMRMNRPVEPGCLSCHASQLQPIYGTQNRYADPPFLQAGIGCERCHGPGGEHAKGDGGMVNPAKLAPQRRDAICAQCHLSGEARIERPDRKLSHYRPGELLSDFVAYFVYEGATESGLKATGHVEKLARSQCRQRSGDRLWCGSCHDPHAVPRPEERVKYYADRCLACHQPHRTPSGVDCAGCHMPRAQVEGVFHGVLTDHSIPRRLAPSNTASPGGRRLVPFGAQSVDARALGLAYAEVSSESGEAFRLLTEALPSHSRDAELLTRLAYLNQQRGDLDRAASLYEAALREEPHRVAAAVNLGSICAGRGQLDRAISLWQDALRRNPALSEAAINLGLALRSKGEQAAAAETLRELLRFDPDLPRAKKLLAQMGLPRR